MLIGIDIDEVLSETIDFALSYHKGKVKGKKLERSQISDYWLPNIPGFEFLTKDEAPLFFIEALTSPQALEELQPVAWAYEVLKERKTFGHRFCAITARGEPTRKSTEERIEKHFPWCFEEIIFCNYYWPEFPKYTKEEICTKKGIKVFIEDNQNYAIDLEKLGIKVFLLEKPWNANFKENEYPWIFKVKKRSDIKL